MKLIDKDALVAEIEKRRKNWWYGSSIEAKYKREECDDILFFLDTLEVREVDKVWHDASETPKGAGDKQILVQFTDYHASVHEIDDWEYLDHQTKWAYLKDLI